MENEKVKTLNDLDSYKWFIFYFDENSINLQFDCNKIEESLKAQRDKIKQFCIDTLTGIEHYADRYFKNHTVNVTINYPLKNPYTFTVKCIVLNDLINEIVLAYRRIYEEEKENPGKYGIWGHRIEDLWLERMILDIETGNVKLFVGS